MSMENATLGLDALDEATRLAEDMLTLVRDSLLVSYRFMNRPLAQLPVRVRMDSRTCSTNARELVFPPGFVLTSFGKTRALVARAYLHMTLHCLLRHPFIPESADPLRWSCACDAAVTALMQQLGGEAIRVDDAERDIELAKIVESVGAPTAPQIYAYLERAQVDEDELLRLSVLFGMDGHDAWLRDGASEPQGLEASESATAKLQEHWEKVARQTQLDMEQSRAGDDASALATALGQIEASPMGLEELLRQFATPSEVIEVNPDEFDYVYYTYGLSLYGNIPLVEPLEYCESPHVRDFVVAIDTSGSVDQQLVEQFVAKACGMLLAENALGNESRVRVVQCDNRIQDERVLREPRDVEGYLDAFELKGRGGTDFRPVFDRVDDLMESGEITDMAGLVYFTDGQGDVPEHAPTYDVAFVFVDKMGPAPSWATSVLAYSDELGFGNKARKD